MSNDELTPEEREALANLPRERMPPAGLEDRVVAAMRERGHLARKPARVIRLTTSRVAGLLAACLVLMVGAYSIGLHRGVNDEVLQKVEPQRSALPSESVRRTELGVPPAIQESDDAGRADAAPNTDVEKQLQEMKAPAFEPPKLNTPQLAAPKDAKKQKRAKTDEVAESMEKSFSDRLSATDMPAPSAAPMPLQSRIASGSAMNASRTFALNGGTLVVDAPDSLRIVTDEQGRTLLIYTSDGVIRIRLPD